MSGINLLKCCCSEEIKCVDCVSKHTSDYVVIVSREYYDRGEWIDCSDAKKSFENRANKPLVVEEPEFFYLNGYSLKGYSPGTITVPNFSYTFNPNTWFTGTCSLERRTFYVSFLIDCAIRATFESPPPAGWDCDPVVKSCCTYTTDLVAWGSCPNEDLGHAGYSIIQEGKDGDVTITADGYEMHLPRIYPTYTFTGLRYFIQPFILLRGVVCPT